jgi:hypothetical protein
MKKIILFLAFVLMEFGCLAAEKREPCAILDQNRTLSQVREILMKDGLFYDQLRVAYADVYNRLTGKNIPATKNGMEMMLQKTVLVHKSFVVPSEYENGVKVGDHVEFTDLIGSESEYWLAAVDDNGRIIDVFGKASCLNPQRKKWQRGGSNGNDGNNNKYVETIYVDTVIVRIINNITYRDSICHTEYVNCIQEEEPEQHQTVMMDCGNYGRGDYYGGYCQPSWGFYWSFPIFYGCPNFTRIVNNYNYYNYTTYEVIEDDDDGSPVTPPGHGRRKTPPGHDDGSKETEPGHNGENNSYFGHRTGDGHDGTPSGQSGTNRGETTRETIYANNGTTTSSSRGTENRGTSNYDFGNYYNTQEAARETQQRTSQNQGYASTPGTRTTGGENTRQANTGGTNTRQTASTGQTPGSSNTRDPRTASYEKQSYSPPGGRATRQSGGSGYSNGSATRFSGGGATRSGGGNSGGGATRSGGGGHAGGGSSRGGR